MFVRAPVPERIHAHNITHFNWQISLGETTADSLISTHCGSITLYRVQCAVEHPFVKLTPYTYYKGTTVLCKQHTALNALKSEKSLSEPTENKPEEGTIFQYTPPTTEGGEATDG